MAEPIKYRPEIDGLRALAVVPVILFHAGANWLRGGFVGVDIFFVISGFLISSIIIREVRDQTFSFLGFYERRLRRIVPALIVTLVVTVTLFQFIALPDQANDTAKSGIAALLSVSNVYFYLGSGYFAPTAEFMPLLHTWSLGVEEQFYLLFPVCIVVLWRLGLGLRWSLLTFTIALFALGVWLSYTRASVAYFLLPSRAWELTLGAFLATVPVLRVGLLREAVTLLGICLIVFSLFYIRSDMPFPGWVALLPCLGAAMIIYAGATSRVAHHLLANRAMVFVGLISYSLYLWHWPILSSLRVWEARVHLDAGTMIAAIGVTFAVAWLSWRFVEKPFRNRREMPVRHLIGSLAAGSAALAAVAITSIAAAGFPGRFSEPARVALAGASDIDKFRLPCANGGSDRSQCRFGNLDAPISVAIIGDSHAMALRPAIEASGLIGDRGATLFWTMSCPFLDGARLLANLQSAKCSAFKSEVWKSIEGNPNLKLVVLAGRWPRHLTGWTPETGGSYKDYLVDRDTKRASTEESKRVFLRSFARTLDRLTARGIDVIIIGSVPEPGFDVPHVTALSIQHNGKEAQGISRRSVEDRAIMADNVIKGLLPTRKHVKFISIWPAFCGEQWCKIEEGGVPSYYDDSHVSVTAAKKIIAPFIARAVGVHSASTNPR